MKTFTQQALNELRGLAVQAAREAGAGIQASRLREFKVDYKSGGSNPASQVVTEVDRQADTLIRAVLKPSCDRYDLALLTEESPDDGMRLVKDAFWSVDPLDGTLAFVESRPGYSVSIGLVARDGTPLIGVVYNPVTDILYSAVSGQEASRQDEPWQSVAAPQQGRPFTLVLDRGFDQRNDFGRIWEGIKAVATRQGCSTVETRVGDGAAMNAMQVLEHAPGCYFKLPKPQQGGGSLWDFAASAAIFQACGAAASDYYGQPLALNRRDSTFMNHEGVMYASDSRLAAALRNELSRE